MKRFALLLLVVALVGGAAWWRLHRAVPVGWQGYAEADYVTIGPTLDGRLTSVPVTRGAMVPAGAVLFTQDAGQDVAALAEARAREAGAEADLANLEQGARPEEIAAAEANLAEARAAAAKMHDDLARSAALLRTGNATRQLVAQQTADAASADAHVKSLAAALALAQAPMGRRAAIKAEAAQVAALRAATAEAQWRVDQRTGRAPAAAVVNDVMAEPGETLSAGDGVVSLLPPANIFVRFFVGETEVARIHRGEQVRFSCDNCPANMTGTISFIAPRAEYTPPVIYSDSQREKLVTEVEARPPPDQALLLNPGLPVSVTPMEQH